MSCSNFPALINLQNMARLNSIGQTHSGILVLASHLEVFLHQLQAQQMLNSMRMYSTHQETRFHKLNLKADM